MKKRMLSLLLALVLVFGMIPVTARAATLSSGLQYEVDYDSVTITGYVGKATSVVIPSKISGYPVTGIGFAAFSDCASLTSVTIPDSVTEIGEGAFSGCASLSSITIPGSVIEIGQFAFYDCASLSSITIPGSVIEIGQFAFYDCDSLTSITIPGSVTSIEVNAFGGCDSLTKISVDKKNTCYSNDSKGVLFDKDKTALIQVPGGLTGSYTIPDSVFVIGGYAFNGCGRLTGITIPDSVFVIGDSAFSGCDSLTSITIPGSVIEIGQYAFYDCDSLTSITIPGSVTSIEVNAFGGCDSLTKISVDKKNTCYSNDSKGVLFDNNKTELIQVPGGLTGSYTIPDSVFVIGNCAFCDCDSLTSVTIGDSVTEIGDEAFYSCDSLTSITIGDSVTEIRFGAFMYCDSLTSITIPGSVTEIGENAFYCCDSLTSVTIGDSVTEIGEYAFYCCDSLTSVTIGDSVTSIEAYAFYGCDSLASIAIPGSVTEIGYDAFSGCDSLASIYFLGDAPSINPYAFNDVVAVAYYPTGNATWTDDALDDYWGDLTWIPYTKVKITKQPSNAAAAKGKTATVSVTAAGDGLTYQWYFKNAGDSKFYPTSAFTGNTYSITMDASRSGRQVYCVITDRYGYSVKTNTVTITMGNPATITKQPTNAAAAAGKAAKVTVGATGDGLTYKWYFKNAGDSKFYPTSAFTGNTYSVNMDASRSGRQVYCVITDKYGTSVTTNTVTLKMATPLAITSQPSSVTVANGATASTTVTATGDNLSYTWYVMDVGNKTWTKSSITSKTYSVGMTPAKSGRHVYCVITDGYGNKVTTKSVTLNMKSGVTITTQPVSTTVANGQTATVKVAASGSGLTYKWYFKNPGDSNFYLTNSFKSNTYSVTMDASRSGRQVYCVISDANGNTVATSIVALKMK